MATVPVRRAEGAERTGAQRAASAPPSPPQPSRIERRRRAARDEFVAAAREVVVRHGIAGFSLERVALEVGLRKQAVYHYFPSKEALLFELVVDGHTAAAHEVADAVAATGGAADAVEALIRSFFGHWRARLALFQLGHTIAPTFDLGRAGGVAQFARIHPLNELLLAGVAERVARERDDGDPDGARRFAFTAYTSTIGLLAMKALVEPAGDPLRHADDALLASLVDTFRRAACARSPTP